MARHLGVLAALLLLTLALVSAGPADDGRWYAGDYSFSDELGGFRILSVTGTGMQDDPIEVREELYSDDPVTLVIRAAKPDAAGILPVGAFHMRVVTVNKSGLPWIEFEFELQEILGKPSDFYDGLSFDQINPNPAFISSNRFARFDSRFESFDRLRFSDGHVDPRDEARFGFFITDVTPVPEFYLLEDPHVPFS
jgi:hypothetical protein